MREFKITIKARVGDNPTRRLMGTIRATAMRDFVTLHKFNLEDVNRLPEDFFPVARRTIRQHVKDFMQDESAPVLWNEVTGIESTITEL